VVNPLIEVGMRLKRCLRFFKTDEKESPVLLFMGEKDESGRIKGERYARRLLEEWTGTKIIS
jgi:hypothetical protein